MTNVAGFLPKYRMAVIDVLVASRRERRLARAEAYRAYELHGDTSLVWLNGRLPYGTLRAKTGALPRLQVSQYNDVASARALARHGMKESDGDRGKDFQNLVLCINMCSTFRDYMIWSEEFSRGTGLARP